MERSLSVECNTVHENLNAKHERVQHYEDDRLMHEHCFVSSRLKGIDSFAICCITCGYCYCNICGKL